MDLAGSAAVAEAPAAVAQRSTRRDMTLQTSVPRSRVAKVARAAHQRPNQERLAMNADTMAPDVDSGMDSSSVVQVVAL